LSLKRDGADSEEASDAHGADSGEANDEAGPMSEEEEEEEDEAETTESSSDDDASIGDGHVPLASSTSESSASQQGPRRNPARNATKKKRLVDEEAEEGDDDIDDGNIKSSSEDAIEGDEQIPASSTPANSASQQGLRRNPACNATTKKRMNKSSSEDENEGDVQGTPPSNAKKMQRRNNTPSPLVVSPEKSQDFPRSPHERVAAGHGRQADVSPAVPPEVASPEFEDYDQPELSAGDYIGIVRQSKDVRVRILKIDEKGNITLVCTDVTPILQFLTCV